jgi:hypothetical protein
MKVGGDRVPAIPWLQLSRQATAPQATAPLKSWLTPSPDMWNLGQKDLSGNAGALIGRCNTIWELICSKVVCMIQRKRSEIISHGEERHMAPMEVRAVLARTSGMLMASRIPPFASCCCLAEASVPSLVAARGWRSLSLSAKTYHEGLFRFAASRDCSTTGSSSVHIEP